jgi:hypothetical protein
MHWLDIGRYIAASASSADSVDRADVLGRTAVRSVTVDDLPVRSHKQGGGFITL